MNKSLIIFLLIGAGIFTFSDIKCNTEQPLAIKAVTAVDPNIQLIVDSMTDVSKEDADKLYKIFSGIHLYVGQTEKIDSTLKCFTIINAMENDFQYKKETYKAYTDAVEKFLTDKGYKKAKKIVETVSDDTKEIARSVVISDLNIISEAARIKRDGK